MRFGRFYGIYIMGTMFPRIFKKNQRRFPIRKTETYTSIYDYFDKFGHGDGDMIAAGIEHRQEAQEILKERLEQEFPGFTFKIVNGCNTLHNPVQLRILFKKSAENNYKNLSLNTDCVTQTIEYVHPDFPQPRLQRVLKKTEADFSDDFANSPIQTTDFSTLFDKLEDTDGKTRTLQLLQTTSIF